MFAGIRFISKIILREKNLLIIEKLLNRWKVSIPQIIFTKKYSVLYLEDQKLYKSDLANTYYPIFYISNFQLNLIFLLALNINFIV